MNFLYTGDFNDEHTNCFIELNNHQYNSADEYKKLQRKSGFLIAECFQNIVRHNEPSNRDSFFHIRNDQGLLSIVSANTVQNEIIPTLQSQLDGLNKLTNDELKEAYRKILTNGEHTENGGAGLGMIEMARRTKNKLHYTFTDIDELRSYFYFKLHLRLEENEQPIVGEFDESILLRSKMIEDQLFFIYKGVISIQTTIIILEVIESTLDSINQKVVFVKFMDFFKQLASKIPGTMESNSSMLFIAEDKIHYSISASCLLNENDAKQLERMVKLFSNLDHEALDFEYQRLYTNSNKDSQHGLELIELMKNSSQLEVHTQAYAEGVSLLTTILKFKKRQRPQFIDHSENKSVKAAQSQKDLSRSLH